jgi:transcriptional regulator with XRE-family HTH domain
MKLDLYRLGRRIAGRRTEHGWTQNDLAERASVTQATIARLEVGQTPGVSLKTIVAIAEALGVGVDYLIGRAKVKDEDEAFTVVG